VITELSPAFGRASVSVRPQDLFLQKGSWVQFSNQWPAEHDWASGKTFTVAEEPVVVSFPMTWTIPGGDYVDVNLATVPSAFTTTLLNLYPSKQGVVYQAAIGFKPYDFFVQVGIPAAQQYVYKLGASYMYPTLTDPNLKYLGEKTAQDSPVNAPLLFFYLINNMPYFFLRLYALEGKNWEKCSVMFYINKCQLQLAPNANPQNALLIPYYSEMTEY
jgi:hypothetical protein